MHDELLGEKNAEQVISDYMEDDFQDVKKEKDINLIVTPEAKAAFSRKPYYMYTNKIEKRKI